MIRSDIDDIDNQLCAVYAVGSTFFQTAEQHSGHVCKRASTYKTTTKVSSFVVHKLGIVLRFAVLKTRVCREDACHNSCTIQ